METTRRRFRTTLRSGVECFWSELSGNAEAEKFDNTNQIVNDWMASLCRGERYPYVLIKNSGPKTDDDFKYISITIMTEAGFRCVADDGQPARYGVNVHLSIHAPFPEPYHDCNAETALRQGLAVLSGVNTFNWAVENVESQHNLAFSATKIDGPRGRRLLALGLPYTVRMLNGADIHGPEVEFLLRGDYVDNRWTNIKFYCVICDNIREPLETSLDKIIRKQGGKTDQSSLYFYGENGIYSPVSLSIGRWIARGPTGDFVDLFDGLNTRSKKEDTTNQPNPGIFSTATAFLGTLLNPWG
ncbi:MAG: hypothetical protein M1840_002808 [Geoglossum simile]|nr:MAG: hypothetical protein M1840_002808 [Geoglossum simile]